MKKNVFCLIVISFFSYVVHGDVSPCDANNWGAYECIQFLQTTILELKGQVNAQSDQLAAQSVRLDNQSNHLSILSTLLASQSNQLATQSLQLNIQSAQLTTHSNLLDTQSTQLKETHVQLEGLQSNPIPIGFIYVQLPGQPQPDSIWQTVTWQDITNDYAGLFFRVLGEGSDEFGVRQAENSPRLIEVQTVSVISEDPHTNVYSNNAFSKGVSSGAWNTLPHWGLSFKQSAGEVRPRNTAVRIWKRTS